MPFDLPTTVATRDLYGAWAMGLRYPWRLEVGSESVGVDTVIRQHDAMGRWHGECSFGPFPRSAAGQRLQEQATALMFRAAYEPMLLPLPMTRPADGMETGVGVLFSTEDAAGVVRVRLGNPSTPLDGSVPLHPWMRTLASPRRVLWLDQITYSLDHSISFRPVPSVLLAEGTQLASVTSMPARVVVVPEAFVLSVRPDSRGEFRIRWTEWVD